MFLNNPTTTKVVSVWLLSPCTFKHSSLYYQSMEYVYHYLYQLVENPLVQFIIAGLPYLIILLLVYLIFFKPRIKDNHSNWNTLIEDFNYSVTDFYEELARELKYEGLQGLETMEVKLHEGSLLSNRRLYLRVTWKDFQYDICAASFGREKFFVSWWLLYRQSLSQILILRIPFIGNWLSSLLHTVTYYKQDTASMFMSVAQASVLKVIDKITKEKGIRIPDDQRKPNIKVANFRKR